MSLLLVLALVGCVTPYRTDLQQGNVVTPDMVEKLRPGMTRSQVRFVLGTPLVTDPFHPNRWDYVYLYRQPDGKEERRQLTIVFDKDTVKQIEGDAVETPRTPTSASRPR
jgi:outer membrane protein assembly factor BamE